MNASFWTDAVTVIRAARVADRGDTVLDWSAATETASAGWRVQPMAGAEPADRRDPLVDRRKAFGPAGTDVDGRDRIRFDGTVFDVVGPVQRWRGPTGALDHIELTLESVEG